MGHTEIANTVSSITITFQPTTVFVRKGRWSCSHHVTNMRRKLSAGLMLAQRLRRWASIKTALGQRLDWVHMCTRKVKKEKVQNHWINVVPQADWVYLVWIDAVSLASSMKKTVRIPFSSIIGKLSLF